MSTNSAITNLSPGSTFSFTIAGVPIFTFNSSGVQISALNSLGATSLTGTGIGPVYALGNIVQQISTATVLTFTPPATANAIYEMSWGAIINSQGTAGNLALSFTYANQRGGSVTVVGVTHTTTGTFAETTTLFTTNNSATPVAVTATAVSALINYDAYAVIRRLN